MKPAIFQLTKSGKYIENSFQINFPNFYIRINLLTLFILASPIEAYSQKNYAALIENYMVAAVNVNQFSGSVLVAKSGNIIYKKTFGTLDFDSKHPLNDNSMFETGNISEQFTAVAILLLKEQGKLKLTDPVTKYLPELSYNNLTIEHLLTHTSGLPVDYYDVMANKWGTEKLATNADMIKFLAEAKVQLSWEPGTQCRCSPSFTDYPLLASVIEKASGQTYSDFMQQNIFTPLHLQNTKVIRELQVNLDLIPNHAEAVYFDESKQSFFPAENYKGFPLELWYASDGIVGANGISSTTNDLFLWDRAIKNNTLLSVNSQKEMFTPYVLKDTASNIYFGYGSLVGKNDLGNYVQQMSGNEVLGFNTKLIRYTDEDITIIVLANKAKTTSGIGGALAEIMFDKDIVLPYNHQAVSIVTTILDKYAGKYKTPANMELVKKDGTLWVRYEGEPDLKLLPESSTKFFSASKEYDTQFEFKLDNYANVEKIYGIFNGLKKEIIKN